MVSRAADGSRDDLAKFRLSDAEARRRLEHEAKVRYQAAQYQAVLGLCGVAQIGLTRT